MTQKWFISCHKWVVLYFFFGCFNVAEIIVTIGNIYDAPANPTLCQSSISPVYCNLRSAWSLCNNNPTLNDTCSIELPANAYLFLNASYGPLVLHHNCSMNMVGNGATVYSDNKMQAIIYYNADDNSSFVPTLSIANTMFTGFGNGYSNGGAISMQGNSHIYWSGVTISSCYGFSGGAVYISRNAYQPVITLCTFHSNYATLNGGSLAVDESVVGMLISNTNIYASIAGYAGGGIVFNTFNHHATLAGVNIQGCRAYVGGGLVFETSNELVTILSVSIIDCDAEYGGGIFLDLFNTNMTLSGIFISGCTAIEFGGGIMVNNGNDFFSLLYSSFLDTIAYVGGGALCFSFNSFSSHMYIDNVLIDSSSSALGGGVIFGSSIDNVIVFNSTLVKCRSGVNAGGIYFGSFITKITVELTDIIECSAPIGGGVSIEQDIEDVQIIESYFANNVAFEAGGGLHSVIDVKMLSIVGSIFHNNSAQKGGGLYVFDSNPDFLMIDTEGFESRQVFESEHDYTVGIPTETHPVAVIANRTIYTEGAKTFVVKFHPLTVVGLTESITIYDSIEKNRQLFRVAQQFPPGLPGIDLPPIKIDGPSFYVEFATDFSQYLAAAASTWGIKMFVYPVFQNPSTPNQIIDNFAAEYGGGIEFRSGVDFPVLINVLVSNNMAGGGGGIYFRSGIAGAVLYQVSFVDNVVFGLGGAGMLVRSVSEGLLLKNCSFYGNVVTGSIGRGGGLFFGSANGDPDSKFTSDNEAIISECVFDSNVAPIGGGLHFEAENYVSIVDSVFIDNYAVEGGGGGISADYSNVVSITNCTFTSNVASACGGGIMLTLSNQVTFTNVFMRYNAALDGGGVCAVEDANIIFSRENTFEGNLATRTGGAISSHASYLFNVLDDDWSSLMCRGNYADRGSALFFMSIQSSARRLRNVTFVHNVAFVGGTVFWLYTSPAGSPMAVPPAGLLWMDNVAAYGKEVATQAIRIDGPEHYYVENYRGALNPSVVYQLVDYYNQTIIVNDTTSLVASVKDSACGDIHAYLSGNDMVGDGIAMHNGIAEFSQLEAHCNPHGNITMSLEARLGNLYGISAHIAAPFYIETKTVLHFRSCYIGETIERGECLVCPKDSYNLAAGEECVECISDAGIETCSGSSIDVKAGYWRRQNGTSYVFECREIDSCLGGNKTGDSACSVGYYGPLCSICEVGYFSSESKCLECTNVNIYTGVTLLVYMGVFFFVGCGFVYGLMHQRPNKVVEKSVEMAELPDEVVARLTIGTDYTRVTPLPGELELIHNDKLIGIIEDVEEENDCDDEEKAIFDAHDLPMHTEAADGSWNNRDSPTNGRLRSASSESSGSNSSPTIEIRKARNLSDDDVTRSKRASPPLLHNRKHMSPSSKVTPSRSRGGSAEADGSTGGARSRICSVSSDGDEGEADVTLFELAWLWINLNSSSIVSKLKIVMSTYQVVEVISVTVVVKFPKMFVQFNDMLGVLNLNIGGAFPFNCSGKYNYIDYMLFTTIFPMALSVLIYLAFVVESWYRHLSKIDSSRFGGKYLFAFLGLTYVVLPIVSTTLFQMFICVNVDPTAEDELGPDLYMQADMSISCQSEYYHNGVLYTIFMIILYPFGILLMYGILLWCNKEEIMQRCDVNTHFQRNTVLKQAQRNTVAPHPTQSLARTGESGVTDGVAAPAQKPRGTILGKLRQTAIAAKDKDLFPDTSDSVIVERNGEDKYPVLSAEASRLSFLWESYKPEFWYFELIETSRKLILTAIIGVIARGSSQQVVLAIVISYMYSELYGYLNPYMLPADNSVAQLGILQIMFTYFCALLIANSLVGDNLNVLLGFCLIMINLLVAVMSLYYSFMEVVDYSLDDDDDTLTSRRVSVDEIELRRKFLDARRRSSVSGQRKLSFGFGSRKASMFGSANISAVKGQK